MITQNERNKGTQGSCAGRRMMRPARVLLALSAVLFLFGCGADEGRSVSGSGVTPPVRTATPAPVLTPTGVTVTPTPEPTAVPVLPVVWAFPMSAEQLFGPDAAPEGFYCPLNLINDKHIFLYETTDNKVVRAEWGSSGYVSTPLAENITAGTAGNTYVDWAAKRFFGQGSRYISASRTDPVIVMVDMATSKRCNIDELVQWKEEGLSLSGDYQYNNGCVLSRLQQYSQGKYTMLNQWAIVDTHTKKYSVLDLSGFKEKNLQQWQHMKELRLALTGGDRLLAICAVKGTVATATAAGDPQAAGCVAFILDLSGGIVRGSGLVSGAGQPGSPLIAGGTAFDVSPDGKYVLYSDTSLKGVYLYDVEKNTEYVILKGGSPSRVFAQWGEGGSIYYGTEMISGQGSATVIRTSVAEVVGKSKP